MASFSMSVQTAKALIDATAWKARSHSVSYGAIPNLNTNLPQSPHHPSVSADQRGWGGRMADASGVFSGGCRVDLGVPLSGRDGGLECQGHDQEQTGEPVGKLVSVKISCVTSVTSLTTAGCSTQQIATCSGRAAAQHSAFKWVNSVRGNVKSAITGTYRAIRAKHIPGYLAEYTYRLNHRYDLTTMIDLLLWHATHAVPPTQIG